MYFNWEHLAVSLNIHIHSKVTLQGLSKYMLLLMATAASPVFFNHPPIWQVLRLSSLNLKRSNKSTFKKTCTHTHTHYASADFMAIAGLYQDRLQLYEMQRKKKHFKMRNLLHVFHRMYSFTEWLHKTSFMVDVYRWHKMTEIQLSDTMRWTRTHSIYRLCLGLQILNEYFSTRAGRGMWFLTFGFGLSFVHSSCWHRP